MNGGANVDVAVLMHDRPAPPTAATAVAPSMARACVPERKSYSTTHTPHPRRRRRPFLPHVPAPGSRAHAASIISPTVSKASVLSMMMSAYGRACSR